VVTSWIYFGKSCDWWCGYPTLSLLSYPLPLLLLLSLFPALLLFFDPFANVYLASFFTRADVVDPTVSKYVPYFYVIVSNGLFYRIFQIIKRIASTITAS
jgi:hypothetical protein